MDQFYRPTGKVQGSPRMAKMTTHAVNTGQKNKPETMGKETGRSATNSTGGGMRKQPRGDTAPLEGH